MFSFLKRKDIEIFAPITGKIVGIEDVPDPVFSGKMIGDGVAIEPTNGMVLAPCEGKVVQIFPTNHAVGIEIKEGIDLLIHLGIDTVELAGKGFERLVKEGETVKVGTPLIKMDLDILTENEKNTITPVIITTMDQIKDINTLNGDVVAGKDLIMTVKIK
ncbi:MAG: PTS glucose transporter subunit IIA [Epulopiscium sp.]|nr:PTS glucose transporter subunit IIA [Candidatus Epulonipiscium sp.]